MDDTENIGRSLERLAESQPAAPALHVPGRTALSYADLGGQIRYVRERLGRWEIERGDVIAGVIPTRPEMAVACATLPAAATFAPLGPAFTTDVYAELLARLRPKAVIVPADPDHPLRPAVRRCGLAEITLIGDLSAHAGVFSLELARHDESLRRPASASPDTAYVVSTSGTTGRRKLVPWKDRRLNLSARAFGDWYRLSPSDVGCHLLPMHLGHGLNSALMLPLLRGTSIVCVEESNIRALFAALDEFRPTWLSAGFTVHKAILRLVSEFHEIASRGGLRFIRAMSGRLEPDEIDRMEQAFAAPLLVALSSMETSGVTSNPLPPRARKRGSIGLPIVNDVRVMNEAGVFCAAGDVGEIVVRGPVVFDGYFDDPAATAAGFEGDWFRTGDLGRHDEDGYFYLVGRVKDVINRGGEKISPAEIDAVIEAHPGVLAAAAFGIPHPTLGEELVAAVVRDGDAQVDAASIIDTVRRRMGPTRVPRGIYFVDRLPRTEAGKIRRSELPGMLGLDRTGGGGDSRSGTDRPAALTSPIEAALAGLWASVLEVGTVGRDDDFFLLGGDSLRGARLIAGVTLVFGVDVTIQALFQEASTIAGMARTIEAARAGGAGTADGSPASTSVAAGTTIPRRAQRGAAVLSDTQRRMWFLATLNPDNPAYNECRAHRLTGAVDVAALRGGLRFVVGRHEILRTVYALVDDEPRQLAREEVTAELRIVDLAAMPPDRQDDALQHVLLTEAQKPFDLERGPLLRLLLVRVSPSDHVLLRVAHHIVSDAWSSGIFDRELSAAYTELVKGGEPGLPALPLQYADYAEWQRERMQGARLQQQLAYWKAQLADVATLPLPTDRPRPPAPSGKGAHVALVLPDALRRALRELARREGATLFMTLLAAFQVLLHRYSGQHDIAVGTPIAGRGRAELEGLIGFFVNTLVLRSDLSGNPGFRELLARVRDCALGAFTHQEVPFEKLVEALAPARDASRNPLFQVMFALQSAPDTALTLDGVQVSRLALPAHSAKFDLYLSLRETTEGLQARWEYSTDLFDAPTIERLARHFCRLLEGIVADPGRGIGALPLLTEPERRRLLVEWNGTAADYPRDRCVHELFEEQAARRPEAVAVIFDDRHLTYGELNTRANRLAHHLIGLGVGREGPVGIYMEPSLELVIGLLGILKAGGAYVPLHPSHPPHRLAFVLEDTGVPLVLTQQALGRRLPPFHGCIVCLDRDWPDIGAHSDANPTTDTTAAALAYVMYTSGSTGQPKGVAVPHRGVVRLVKGADYVSLDASDTLLHLAPLSFDASTFELWGALLNGGRVVLPPSSPPAPADIGEAIRRHRVTTLWLPAGLFHLMVDERPDDLGPLRQLLAGGDVLSAEHLVKARRALPGVRLVNGYGPTENTTFTCCYTVPDAGPVASTVPIGRPIANTRVYVLDPHLQPVPVGVAGVLYAGGDGMARGYWRRPELTAERFVPDPYAGVPGARMYCTGDRARYLPDGNIEFLGRVDGQVKLRGFRIELGEVEAALGEHPAVREAVVAVREDAPGDKRLIAYVVPAEAAFPGTEPLRALVRERLPEYMRPSAYVALERLPLSPNGKVDRRALPAPSPPDEADRRSYVAPRDEVEHTVCRIWEGMLRAGRVGLDDNFFELGGHSLLAARLSSRLDRAFGRSLPLAALLEAPTVRELARLYRDGALPEDRERRC